MSSKRQAELSEFWKGSWHCWNTVNKNNLIDEVKAVFREHESFTSFLKVFVNTKYIFFKNENL